MTAVLPDENPWGQEVAELLNTPLSLEMLGELFLEYLSGDPPKCRQLIEDLRQRRPPAPAIRKFRQGFTRIEATFAISVFRQWLRFKRPIALSEVRDDSLWLERCSYGLLGRGLQEGIRIGLLESWRQRYLPGRIHQVRISPEATKDYGRVDLQLGQTYDLRRLAGWQGGGEFDPEEIDRVKVPEWTPITVKCGVLALASELLLGRRRIDLEALRKSGLFVGVNSRPKSVLITGIKAVSLIEDLPTWRFRMLNRGRPNPRPWNLPEDQVCSLEALVTALKPQLVGGFVRLPNPEISIDYSGAIERP